MFIEYLVVLARLSVMPDSDRRTHVSSLCIALAELDPKVVLTASGQC